MTKEEYLNSDFVTMLHLNNQVVGLSQKNKKLEKENEQLRQENKQLQQKWLDSEYEKSKLVSQIKKMECCENCKYHSFWGDELKCNYGMKEALQEDKLVECKDMDKWELAE